MSDVGYSGTPLHRKLGVKPASRVLIVGAPSSFALDEVPAGATLHTRATGSSYDVVLAFCPDRPGLSRRMSSLPARVVVNGALWIAWPKKSSRMTTDLSEDVVRQSGLAAGLVDVKVIAVDATWSALKFVRRLRDR